MTAFLILWSCSFVGSSYVLTLLVGAFMIQANQITVGNLVTFITYLDMLVWPLMAIGFLFNITQRGKVSYQRIESLLSQESPVKDPESPLDEIKMGAWTMLLRVLLLKTKRR